VLAIAKKMKNIQTNSISIAFHNFRKVNLHYRIPIPIYLQQTHTISITP
jgi:hypothetical protein